MWHPGFTQDVSRPYIGPPGWHPAGWAVGQSWALAAVALLPCSLLAVCGIRYWQARRAQQQQQQQAKYVQVLPLPTLGGQLSFPPAPDANGRQQRSRIGAVLS